MRCAVAQPPPLVRPATHVYKKKCAGRLYCAEPAFLGLHHVPVLNCGRPTCETPVCFPLALRADHIANADLYCGHAQHFQRLCFRPPVGFAKLPSCTYRPSQHNLHHNIPLPVVFAQLHLGPRRNCPLSRALSCCWWTNTRAHVHTIFARACADSLAVTNSWQCWFQARIYGQLT